LQQFFEQITTCQILLDLLYENGLYQNMLDTFHTIQKWQIQGQKFPRNVTILVFAACYKLNSIQSYETLLQLLNEMRELGVEPVRRCISFAAALALNQNAPQVALEVLSNSRNSNYVSIRNLKLWGLAELNRPDDCLPILRFSIEFDSAENTKRHSVLQEILEKVGASVERLENKEVSLEFDRIRKALVEGNQVSKQTVAELLEAEIEGLTPGQAAGKQGFQQFGMDRSFRMGQRVDSRDSRPQRSSYSSNYESGIHRQNSQNQRLKNDIY
jgi:pentatricopeptide repeat domain-containing protein 2